MTGQVRERQREDYFSVEAPVNYNPNADSRRVDQALNAITLDDKDFRLFLENIAGYMAIGGDPLPHLAHPGWYRRQWQDAILKYDPGVLKAVLWGCPTGRVSTRRKQDVWWSDAAPRPAGGKTCRGTGRIR